MYGLILTIHIIICVLLVGIVLIQSGRGGGLIENFSSAESIFGTKTSSFLTRSTAVLATLFMITCLSLAFLSAKRSRSLMRKVPSEMEQKETLPMSAGQKEKPAKDIVSKSTDEKIPSLPQPEQATNAESLPSGQ